jgi:hypothetical protein
MHIRYSISTVGRGKKFSISSGEIDCGQIAKGEIHKLLKNANSYIMPVFIYASMEVVYRCLINFAYNYKTNKNEFWRFLLPPSYK